MQNSALNKGKVYHNRDFYEIATAAEHRCTLVDLCGHEKYLKTTIYGLTGMTPNCAMVIVGANHGVQRMTREHIGLCCALKLPFFLVVTKVDMCPKQVFKETEVKIKKVLKRAGRKSLFIRSDEDVNKAVECMQHGNFFAPVFIVSAVTGQGINALRILIRRLTVEHAESPVTQKPFAEEKDQSSSDEITLLEELDALAISKSIVSTFSEYYVDDTFQVPGVGVVLGGSLRSGENLNVNDNLLIGPDSIGKYLSVTVKSIHRQCVPSETVFPGQHATLAIKSTAIKGGGGTKLKKAMFHKGMVCIKESENTKMKLKIGRSIIEKHTVYEFEADVKILHHSTTINPGYSPVVHLGVVRQASKILSIKNVSGEDVVARTGSQVLVRFRFLHSMEYLTIGRAVVFREGRAKGCGNVTRLFPEAN